MNTRADTIAAVASAPGAGGVGVLRVSGPLAAMIALALFGRAPRPRHAHYTAFRAGNGEVIDRGLLLWFPAPRSYTGEDVLELQAHGSPVVLRLLLARVLELGARHARPGEFSERAFLNGQIDLAQAEAVADLIASGSETAARAAQRSLEGDFSERVRALTERVVRLRVWIESAIDFPEEEIDFLADAGLAALVDAARADSRTLLAATRRGVRLAGGCTSSSSGDPTSASRVCSTRSHRASARSSPKSPAPHATCCARLSSSMESPSRWSTPPACAKRVTPSSAKACVARVSSSNGPMSPSW